MAATTYVSPENLGYFKDKCDDVYAGKAVATSSANGLMSSADKTKLDGLKQQDSFKPMDNGEIDAIFTSA